MRRATVSDVMTREVVTFRPDTPFIDIVRTLSERNISGAPVIGPDGRVLGIVSETDALRKEEYKSPGEDSPPRFESRHHREVRQRAAGDTAAEIMSSPAVCVPMETTVVEAARLMAQRKVNRLPVLEPGGRLAGIVTRSDLLRVFLRSDEAIRDEVVGDVLRRYLWQDVKLVEVDVKDGVVTLRGALDLRSLIPTAVRLTSAVEGVVRVVDELSYDQDDTSAGARRAGNGFDHRH
jgi:CBS domain-containing protein